MHKSENLPRHVITHTGVGTHIQTHFNNVCIYYIITCDITPFFYSLSCHRITVCSLL